MTDPVTKEAPVLRLKGMLTMLDWVDALATYDKDGDYGVFAPLLEADGMDQGRADQLARAAFFERTSNPVKAREALHTVVPSVEGHGGKMARLFRAQLGRRLSWFRKPYRDEQELALADAYLARCDYLRAAVFMLEAWVSRAVATKGLDINDYETRKAALDEGKVTSTAVRGSPLKDLTALRNAMAHGLKSRDMRAAKNMGAESDLRQTLTHIRKQLFG
jgi:hypothetical protein